MNMSEQCRLLELEQRPESEPEAAAAVTWEQLKLRRPERRQIVFAEIDVERLVGEDNAVRAIWALTGRLDLSGFAAGLRSEQGAAGRARSPPTGSQPRSTSSGAPDAGWTAQYRRMPTCWPRRWLSSSRRGVSRKRALPATRSRPSPARNWVTSVLASCCSSSATHRPRRARHPLADPLQKSQTTWSSSSMSTGLGRTAAASV